MKHNRRVGLWGEHYALSFLKKYGYEFVQSNYYSRFGEIDLIVFDRCEKQLVFVEVKTRKSSHFGYPEEAVLGRKKARMYKAGLAFLMEHEQYEDNYRFDVISILLAKEPNRAKIRHVKAVFCGK